MTRIVITYDPATVVLDSESYDLAARLADFFASAEINATIDEGPLFLWSSPEQDGHVATLDEMLHDNRGDNELFCDWLRNAKVGQYYSQGGGASPRITTWRVS